MNKIDHLALDGHALKLFLVVLEEGSVTAAATRLGMTQSAVSHSLRKLRRILRDPLFVKAGRGIVATAHARALSEQARQLLDELQAFSRGAEFDPSSARLSLTIAANDFQRDLLLPALFRRVEAVAQPMRLRVIPSELPTAEMLRENRCDLLISPRPPTGIDVLQKRLLRDRYRCFYDPAMRPAPRTSADYLAARHVTVVYTDNERLNFDKRLEAAGMVRDIAVSVPSFSGIPAFLRGSRMLASMPGLMGPRLMRDFAGAPIPLDGRLPPSLCDLPLYIAWHRRFQFDPAHAWLRGLVIEVAAEILRSNRMRGISRPQC
ncbi:MAG: LysR family transcriptional regulator [Hyphomicrobiales bacterium]